ncbi:hypothetical protein MTR67_025698 [Solanum verrucosum]|uniref:C-JID domain-containing protein n=1 Tax=Solanum verrucosum TaxID=315347 RepID=A0AAF0R1B1_SOLVR|nr:hypothetical protein MTR67_025698 [Solanum verrucosum]
MGLENEEGTSRENLGTRSATRTCSSGFVVFISINNTIEMHDLIQEMGKYVVKMHKDSGEPSRIWNIEDFKEVIDNNTIRGNHNCNSLFQKISSVSNSWSLRALMSWGINIPGITQKLSLSNHSECDPEISFFLIPLSDLWDTSKANGRTPNDYGLFTFCFCGEMKHYGLRLLYKVDPELDANCK